MTQLAERMLTDMFELTGRIVKLLDKYPPWDVDQKRDLEQIRGHFLSFQDGKWIERANVEIGRYDLQKGLHAVFAMWAEVMVMMDAAMPISTRMPGHANNRVFAVNAAYVFKVLHDEDDDEDVHLMREYRQLIQYLNDLQPLINPKNGYWQKRYHPQ